MWLGKGLARAARTLAAVVLRGLGALSAELGVGPELVLCLRFFLLSFPPCLSSRVFFSLCRLSFKRLPPNLYKFPSSYEQQALVQWRLCSLGDKAEGLFTPPNPTLSLPLPFIPHSLMSSLRSFPGTHTHTYSQTQPPSQAPALVGLMHRSQQSFSMGECLEWR